MPIIGKDISLLTQKSSVAGTEKLPVSDTEFITPDQITAGKMDKFSTTAPVDIVEDLDLNWKSGNAFNWENGNTRTSSSSSYTQTYVPIPSGATRLKYLSATVTTDTTQNGICFYNASKVFMSGVSYITGAASAGVQDNEIDIPQGAAYVRFSIYTSQTENFYAAIPSTDDGKIGMVDEDGVFALSFVKYGGTPMSLQRIMDEINAEIGDVETLLAEL